MSHPLDVELKLKAAIEFGSLYTYQVLNGSLGKTLRIYAECKEEATLVRQKAPCTWEGLYVVVIYPTHILTRDQLDEEDIDLYDPKLK